MIAEFDWAISYIGQYWKVGGNRVSKMEKSDLGGGEYHLTAQEKEIWRMGDHWRWMGDRQRRRRGLGNRVTYWQKGQLPAFIYCLAQIGSFSAKGPLI